MPMPKRSYTGESYRFGFNGKENDKEWGGGGLTQDYGFRLYNPALGKFLSVDPLFNGYPWFTPYQFAGNMPIWAIDLDGLEAWIATNEAEKVMSLLDYNDFSNTLLKKVDAGDLNNYQFDCADLALFNLVRYFEEKGVRLELSVTDANGRTLRFDSDNERYTGKGSDGFFEHVRLSVGAKQVYQLSFSINHDDMVSGDLYVLGGENAYHVTLEFNAIKPNNEAEGHGVIRASGEFHGYNDENNKIDPIRSDYFNDYSNNQARRWNLLQNVPQRKQEELNELPLRKIDAIPTNN
jgi:RHS repeat-associated protein